MKTCLTITAQSQNEFNRTLKNYLDYAGRTLPEALNEKAYFIVGGGGGNPGAIRLTHKADYQKIERELGVGMLTVYGKRGRATKKKTLGFTGDYSTALAVKIIIARLRKKGQKIPDAVDLMEMALAMVRARVRSVAFIRSGWIPALKRLARFSKYGSVKLEPSEKGSQYGIAKGGCTPAARSGGLSSRVIFWNSAGGEAKHKGALQKYGGAGLDAAFRAETASMKEYIERKMREGAVKVGIRVK